MENIITCKVYGVQELRNFNAQFCLDCAIQRNQDSIEKSQKTWYEGVKRDRRFTKTDNQK